jgi:hypothetical protein
VNRGGGEKAYCENRLIDLLLAAFLPDVEKGRRGLFQRRKAKSVVFAFLRFSRG